MIKLNHIETMGWRHAIRGMRNPLESWRKSDSYEIIDDGINYCTVDTTFNSFTLGENDLDLCKRLIKAGASHRKFLRQINIYVDITANEKFFDEYSTYLHTVNNSTSQMHCLTKNPFTLSDFSYEITTEIAKNSLVQTIKTINNLRLQYLSEENITRKKDIWRDMIELIPQSFLYTRTCMLNYEVFLSMYFQRKTHKMSEWVEMMNTLRNELPYMNEFIKVLEK